MDVGFRPIHDRFLPMYKCSDVILDYFPIFVPDTVSLFSPVFYVRHHFACFYFRGSLVLAPNFVARDPLHPCLAGFTYCVLKSHTAPQSACFMSPVIYLHGFHCSGYFVCL